MVPFQSGADGVVRPAKQFGRTDHPVCGASVASQLLINAAASPPLQGGEWACPYFTHSFCGKGIRQRNFQRNTMPPYANLWDLWHSVHWFDSKQRAVLLVGQQI